MYNRFKEQSERLLPMPFYQKMVPAEKQKHEIELLKETLHFDRFFFILNLHELKIEHVHGVQKWLGYKDEDFNLLKFLQIIHPAHLVAHNVTATVLIEGLMRGDWKIEFMKHRYINNIALQHYDGHYILFKRLASVFQYDKEHKLLEYVNEFTIVDEYKDESYAIRAYNDDGTKLRWLEDVVQRTKELFQNKHLFSFQELRILRKYAYLPHLSSVEIAKAFNIKKNTVIEFNKRILDKAEKLFLKRFTNAKLVAVFLKEQGLL